MLKSLSLKGILAGGSLLVAAIWLNEALISVCAPLTDHVTIATVALLHCTAKFIALPAIAGYLSGRIAGHHHGLNGMLAIVPLLLIAVAPEIVQDGEALDAASVAFMVWGMVGLLGVGWLSGHVSAHPRQELAALVAFFTGRPIRQSMPGSSLPSQRGFAVAGED